MTKFEVKRVCCSLCNSKTGVRRVNFQLHKKLPQVVPIGSGIKNQ